MGRRLARDVAPERILRWDDLEKVTRVSPRKICIVIGSRANYSSIKSVMRAVQAHPELGIAARVGSVSFARSLWRSC